MASRYYRITEEEMDDLLTGFGFEPVEVEGTRELVYEFKHPKSPGYGIRVYTSIQRGEARGVGEDAIRCVYWDHELNRPFFGTPRVLRIQTWKKNLTNRLRTMAGIVARVDEICCPECGAPMAKRESKHGSFYGCFRYPDCKGTRRVAEVEAWLDRVETEVLMRLKATNRLE